MVKGQKRCSRETGGGEWRLQGGVASALGNQQAQECPSNWGVERSWAKLGVFVRDHGGQEQGNEAGMERNGQHRDTFQWQTARFADRV